MSEMVRYTGKLRLKEKLPNETLEEQCKRILREHNYLELQDYCDSWKEMLYDELYERYVVYNNEVYEVIEGVNGLSGNNAKELFEDVASKLSNINSEIEGLGEICRGALHQHYSRI